MPVRADAWYPGGALNLRRHVWLRVPYPPPAPGGHPRQRVIDLVREAHTAGAIDWLLAADSSDTAADKASAAAAGLINDALAEIVVPGPGGKPTPLRDLARAVGVLVPKD